MKKLLIAILLATFIVPTVAGAADIPDEQLKRPGPPVENTGGYSGVYYDDQSTLNRAFYYLNVWKGTGAYDSNPTICTSALDEPCKSSNYLFFETPLSPCSDARTRDCVVSFSGRLGEKPWAAAQLVEKTNSNFPDMGTEYKPRYATPFTGDVARGIPDSGEVSIWKIPGMPHVGGDEYLLIPKLNVNFQNVSGTRPSNLDVGVFPVSRVSAAGKKASDCFFITTSTCFVRWPFPQDSGFKVSIKTGSKIIGWFHGRIYNPGIQSEKTSDGQTLITIEGQSMLVPTLGVWAKNTDLPSELNKMIEDEFTARGNMFAGTAYFGGNEKSRALQAVLDDRNPSFNDNEFTRYMYWVKIANDKAYANNSTWSFRSMTEYSQYERCLGDNGVAGIVTTNSNAYISGPPKFADGELSYKVASPHYDSKGALQIGTYDLAIRSDVARCIYGFTSAPIQASLSIVYDDGVSKTATTVISEKDNWLRLSAKGFTYSSPTVRISLKQAKALSTITCVKGKTSKKVTAANPKCPTGYKKK